MLRLRPERTIQQGLMTLPELPPTTILYVAVYAEEDGTLSSTAAADPQLIAATDTDKAIAMEILRRTADTILRGT